MQHEAVRAQPAEVTHDRLAVQAEVRRDPPGAGLGHEPALGVESGVQGDVFEDAPGGQPDRPLDHAAGGEDLGERLRAAEDAPVGQHPAVLLAQRHDVAGLPRRPRRRARGIPRHRGAARVREVTKRSQRAGTTPAPRWQPAPLDGAKPLVSGAVCRSAPRPDTGLNELITRRSQVQILPSQLRKNPWSAGGFCFVVVQR